MRTEPELFPAPWPGREAQLETLRKIEPRLGNLQRRVYRTIIEAGRGICAYEICERIGRPGKHNSVAPRCNELHSMGLIFSPGTVQYNNEANTAWQALDVSPDAAERGIANWKREQGKTAKRRENSRWRYADTEPPTKVGVYIVYFALSGHLLPMTWDGDHFRQINKPYDPEQRPGWLQSPARWRPLPLPPTR